MLEFMKKGGKKKEEIVSYKRPSLDKTSVKGPSKEDVEEKLGRIKEMKEEAEDIRVGEKDFGSSYKDLNLKGTRKVALDKAGNASIKAKYTSKDEDEEVSKIPDSDMLQVKKIGLAANTDGSEFKESIKERISRIDDEKKKSLKLRAMRLIEKSKLK